MTIDSVIENLKYDVEIDMYIRDIAPQIAEWLEELKTTRNLDKTNFSDGYNKAFEDVMNMLNGIEFDGGTKETLACANATLNYIKEEVEKLRSDG